MQSRILLTDEIDASNIVFISFLMLNGGTCNAAEDDEPVDFQVVLNSGSTVTLASTSTSASVQSFHIPLHSSYQVHGVRFRWIQSNFGRNSDIWLLDNVLFSITPLPTLIYQPRWTASQGTASWQSLGSGTVSTTACGASDVLSYASSTTIVSRVLTSQAISAASNSIVAQFELRIGCNNDFELDERYPVRTFHNKEREKK